MDVAPLAQESAGDVRVRRDARVAVAALFFTNGALFANLLPRYPEIKSDLGLTNAALGSAIAAFPLGALLAGLFAAALINRFRSARVAVVGIVIMAAVLALVAVAGTWVALAIILFVAGALDAVIDVAQNAHGLRVQRRYGRSIVNSFHGVWSIGAVTGGLLGAAATGLGVPLAVHMFTTSAMFSAVALVCYRFLLPGPEHAERDAAGHTVYADGPIGADLAAARRPATSAERRAIRSASIRVLLILGVLAACGAVVEDAGASWGALYLDGLGAGAALAGLAFVALQTTMTVGRLVGDRVVDRFGERAVVRCGGGVAAVGMAAALAWPTVGTTLVGFALAGIGVATLVPAAMHASDELPGLAVGVGLTVVSWLLRVGFLLSPPLVGLVADHVSLRAGLLGAVLAGVLVVLLGRVLPGRRVPAPR
jgi:MFS family permease